MTIDGCDRRRFEGQNAGADFDRSSGTQAFAAAAFDFDSTNAGSVGAAEVLDPPAPALLEDPCMRSRYSMIGGEIEVDVEAGFGPAYDNLARLRLKSGILRSTR